MHKPCIKTSFETSHRACDGPFSNASVSNYTPCKQTHNANSVRKSLQKRMHCALFGAPHNGRGVILYHAQYAIQKWHCLKNAMSASTAAASCLYISPRTLFKAHTGEQVFGRCKVELKKLHHFLKSFISSAAIRTGKRSCSKHGLQVLSSACLRFRKRAFWHRDKLDVCLELRRSSVSVPFFCFMSVFSFMIPPFN